MGSDTGLTFGLGQTVTVRLAGADPVTGAISLELLELQGQPIARGPRHGRPGKGFKGAKPGRGKPGPRKPAAEKAKAAKVKRKVARTRR